MIALIAGMLNVNPTNRFTLNQVKGDRWTNIGFEPVKNELPATLDETWIREILLKNTCKAGCLIMQQLEKLVPSGTLVPPPEKEEATDESLLSEKQDEMVNRTTKKPNIFKKLISAFSKRIPSNPNESFDFEEKKSRTRQLTDFIKNKFPSKSRV